MNNSANPATVIVYSTTWCAFCKMAKDYFDKLGVTYKDIDVEKDPAAAQEMVAKSHQMGVPVITIGANLIIGFDKPKIDAALKENKLVK